MSKYSKITINATIQLLYREGNKHTHTSVKYYYDALSTCTCMYHCVHTTVHVYMYSTCVYTCTYAHCVYMYVFTLYM